MKSVLLSIKPKYVELIASGEKMIEVRKSKPKLEMPFKCYIYCTNRPFDITDIQDLNVESVKKTAFGRGKVIGEFVCNRIEKYEWLFPFESEDFQHALPQGHLEKTCLEDYELDEYLDDKAGYGWHISDLKIYDKPKELSEFRKPCKFAYSSYEEGICYEDCIQGKLEDCRNFCLPITRPPQSWCYVESLGE